MSKDLREVDLVRTEQITPEQLRQATATVASFARDDEEHHMFLQMLGLDHEV